MIRGAAFCLSQKQAGSRVKPGKTRVCRHNFARHPSVSWGLEPLGAVLAALSPSFRWDDDALSTVLPPVRGKTWRPDWLGSAPCRMAHSLFLGPPVSDREGPSQASRLYPRNRNAHHPEPCRLPRQLNARKHACDSRIHWAGFLGPANLPRPPATNSRPHARSDSNSVWRQANGSLFSPQWRCALTLEQLPSPPPHFRA